MILDTNALSAWLDGDLAMEDVLSRAPRLFLSSVVLGEYHYGILFSRKLAEYAEKLRAIESELPVLPVDTATARHYATLRKALKTAGTPIPRHDLWISAQAAQHAVPVLSRDSHFDLVPGIQRVTW